MRPTTLLPNIHTGNDDCMIRVNVRPSIHRYEGALHDMPCRAERPVALAGIPYGTDAMAPQGYCDSVARACLDRASIPSESHACHAGCYSFAWANVAVTTSSSRSTIISISCAREL